MDFNIQNNIYTKIKNTLFSITTISKNKHLKYPVTNLSSFYKINFNFHFKIIKMTHLSKLTHNIFHTKNITFTNLKKNYIM